MLRIFLPAFEGFCQRFSQGSYQPRPDFYFQNMRSRMSKLLLCTVALVGAAAWAHATPVPLLNPNFDAITQTYKGGYPGTVTFVSITVTAAGYNAANFGDGVTLYGTGFTTTWSDNSTETGTLNASTYFGTPAGWLGVGTANAVGYEALGANYMALKPGASVVDFAGYTVGTSVVSQVTGATIQANTIYTLTYLLGTRNNTPPVAPGYLQGTSVKLTADAASNPAPANGNWAAQTLVFDTSNPANVGLVGQALTVGFTGGAGTSIVFDNVTLDATPIPDPATIAPVITGVAPGTGLTNGGTVVTITGSHFLAGVTVKFGANAATGVSLTGSTSLTATTPAGLPGAVNVVVVNTNTLAGTNFNGFNYVPPPTPLPPKLRGISTSDKHLKADLFALLAQTDANVIRLGFSVDSTNPPTAQNPLAPYATNLAILDAALPLARAAGIKIVLCAAETYGWSPTVFQGSAASLATYRTNLATFWTAMAQRYLNESAIVAYDLLNEPVTDYFSQGAWYNNVLPAAVAAVRSVNSSIWLLVESEYQAQAGNFNTLPVLADPYVIYSFHMYAPGSYVGQGLGAFTNYFPTYPGTNSMWGPADTNSIYTYWDKEALRNAMITEINFSKAHPDKRILVGEFGVFRWASGADKWLNDCIELFEEYGWDWCNHSPSGWNGFNVTYSTNINDPAYANLAPDGGDRGARWTVLHQWLSFNQLDAYGIPSGWKTRYFGATNAVNGGALDDWDHDGMNNLQEYLAGTDPTNASSKFQVTSFNWQSGTNFVIQWSSVAGKRYALQTSTNLLAGFDGLLTNHVPGTPPLNTATVSMDQVRSRYYRVMVEP